MYKVILLAVVLTVASAAPEPKAKPGIVAAYTAPVAAPVAYTAPYVAPAYYSAAYAAPYAYPAAYTAYSAYSAYSAPLIYG